MSILIKGMEMPKDRPQLLWVYPNGKTLTVQSDVDPWKELQAIPVPDHGQLLKVLKTERECVSRDCDRNCGKCDLSLEQSEILTVYDTLVSMFSDPADKEGEG